MDRSAELRKPKTSHFALTASLAVVAGLARLIPHPWNFTPVGALGLFGGARLRLWQALTLPLAIMAGSDLIIWAWKGWPPFNPVVYGCFVVSVLIGRLLTRTNSPARILLCTVLASLQFFLVTNFSVWAAYRVDPRTLPDGALFTTKADEKFAYRVIYYPDNVQGLATCYWMAAAFSRPEAPPLGFFGNLLAGDIFFTGLLFAAHALVARRFLRPAAVPAVR